MASIKGLSEALSAANPSAGSPKSLPPVHLWNPPHCGDIGMKIASNGRWFYQNSPIQRQPLVKLFASILRKDPDGHVLVTPVEKVSVEVEDAPFLAVELRVAQTPLGPQLSFQTNVEDWVTLDADHPLRCVTGPAGGLKPYVLVRDDLWALVSRPLVFDLVALGETRDIGGKQMYGLVSSGQFFELAALADLETGRDDDFRNTQ